MGTFATRQVILLPFPFSDLSRSKVRPAAILAHVGRGDWLLCQITSNPYADPLAIPLEEDAFVHGGLQRISFARPGKLFTASESVFSKVAGVSSKAAHEELVETLVCLLRENRMEGGISEMT